MFGAYQLIYLFISFVILNTIINAQLSERIRRRPTQLSSKYTTDNVSEKSLVPDQTTLVAKGNYALKNQPQSQSQHYPHRNPGTKVDSGHDYGYGKLELNLIHAESETPITAKLSEHYTNNLSTTNHNQVDDITLEDSETAAEYVANAMKIAYGARLKEPIHIPHETERPLVLNSFNEGGGVATITTTTTTATTTSGGNQKHSSKHNNHFNYHEHLNKQLQPSLLHRQPTAAKHQIADEQQQQQALLEAQIQAELQSQLAQQAQLLAAESQNEHGAIKQQQIYQHKQSQELEIKQPAPVYENNPLTHPYEDYNNANQGIVGFYEDNSDEQNSAVDRHYRTKYVYYQQQPQSQTQQLSQMSHLYHTQDTLEQEGEEKILVPASTEIPKAEIMKQIEKSVLKYIKELEAEGKIITTPQEPAKAYYKIVTAAGATSDKHSISSTTMRPKYSTPLVPSSNSANYGNSAAVSAINGGNTLTSSTTTFTQRHPVKHRTVATKQHYQSEIEAAYHAPDVTDASAPNVEFTYKIKARTPLQTATVKTITKPYTLPLKGATSNAANIGTYKSSFDHSSALKNIEEFDLSHVVTTPENDEGVVVASSTSKPQKLYFNSETFQDINSLPYKAEKFQHDIEYRNKLKNSAISDMHTNYKSYSGYFAEPAPNSMEAEKEVYSDTAANPENGYLISNPYQFILKKQPLSSKYEDASIAAGSWEQATRLHHGKPLYSAQKSKSGSTSLEYDSYSPKFNNNPEGYGYQHTYKTHVVRHANGTSGTKRGKRGGGSHPSQMHIGKKITRNNARVKVIEANLALRPPPKK